MRRVRQSSYYIDKTNVIRLLDAAPSDHLLLVWPSRVGKTLLCNMLNTFYDCKGAENFSALFDGLAIADYDWLQLMTCSSSAIMRPRWERL